MKRKWYLTALAAIAAGGGLHFLYDLWPNPLTAVFAPVNESVWEHLKLLYWPFLAASFFLMRDNPDRRRSWSAFLAAQLAMPGFLLGSYYALRCGFAVYGLAVDLTLYALTMALGFRLARRLLRSGRAEPLCGMLVIAAGVYGAALALFSFAPPQLPVFLPPA